MTTALELELEATPTRGPAYDLLLRLPELGERLVDAVRRTDWLNAYLYAAGMNQIAEDGLHADVCFLGQLGDRLLSTGRAGNALAGRGLDGAASAGLRLRGRRERWRRALAWQQDLAAVVATLARTVTAPERASAPDVAGLEAAVEALVSVSRGLPAELRWTSAHLPSCFHAFDLDVPDAVSLAAAFSRSRAGRRGPLLVAGVRTSGSYLAPLCAAALESFGHPDVQVLTLRPRHQLLRTERELVRRTTRGHGLVLVIDDPPESGRSVARVADRLARLGVPPAAILLLLPRFADRDSLPPQLTRYPSVILPAGEWSIEAKLAPEAVGRALGRLLSAGTRVTGVEPQPLPERPRRAHRRGLFRVDLLEHGRRRTIAVVVEGVGIGYFGEQAVAVARELRDHLPELFGLEGGCLYRAWIPDARRACPPGARASDELVTAVASYAAARRQALSVAEDRSLGELGDQPVWEVASGILSRAFGRGALPARLLAVDPLAKRLLRVEHPSVTDGATSFANWFADERDPGRLVKVDFAKRSFWHLGLLCYDAAFDIASAALSTADAGTAERLRATYARLVGEPVDDERWLLYQLAELWGRRRRRPGDAAAVERAQARCLRRHVARLYLADLEQVADGPLCALDLDGVLETEALGFPGTTTAGALSLRALIVHGYRPLLVSGRSVDDVADRCRSYGLAGGVAEYGAVVYTAAPEETRVLLTRDERAALSQVRDALASHPGVQLDDAYRYCVRAFAPDRRGRRGPLDPAIAEAARRASGASTLVRVVPGESQTDFVPAGVDKGYGVRALAARLRPPERSGSLLALAVGDTAEDLPMLREAALGFAPAQGRGALRRTGVEVLRAPYQAGLAIAVERLLGHRPGACPACREPRLAPEAAILFALVSAGEGGRLRLAWELLRLTRLARPLTRHA